MGFLREYEMLSSADARRALLFQWMSQRRHELYTELREHAPVFSTPDFFLVTRYEDVRDIIVNGDRFKARSYTMSGKFVLGKDKKSQHPLALQQPPHELMHDEDRAFLEQLLPREDLKRIREIASKAARKFVDAALSADEELLTVIEKDPLLRATIKTNVQETQSMARGRIDLLAEFARLVPIEVVKAYFGVPEPDPEDFNFPVPRHPDPVVTKRRARTLPFIEPTFPCLFNWTSANSRAFRYVTYDQFFAPNLVFEREVASRAVQVRDGFAAHLKTLFAQLDKLPKDTLIVKLAAGIGKRGYHQTVRDAVGMIGGMVDNVGDTTCLALDVLLSHPAALAQATVIAKEIDRQLTAGAGDDTIESLRNDLWQYIREALRFAPPVPFFTRTLDEDWTHSSGVVIPAARRIFAATGSALMDENEFPRPNEFLLEHCPKDNEEKDLYFGVGWHACFGKDVGREQIIEMVRHLLLLPDLRRASGMAGRLEFEYFTPKRFVVEFGPKPVQTALTAVMTIKPPEERNYRALKRLLSHAYVPLEQLLNQVGTVHFARFLFLENNTKLALITSFDGDFDTYIKHYVEIAGPLFDLMLNYMKDAPPLPVREHRDEFVEYVRRCDLGSETPFYSAYSNLTVQEILGRR